MIISNCIIVNFIANNNKLPAQLIITHGMEAILASFLNIANKLFCNLTFNITSGFDL